MRNILLLLTLLLSDTLAAGDLSTLTAIAGQCPLEGGDAVYEARAFVNYLTGESFDDEEMCSLAEERRQKPEHPVEAVSEAPVAVYPNPTTGRFWWTGTGEQAVRVLVFNAFGQVVLNETRTNGSVTLERLPGGFYQVQLLSADHSVLATHKVQLIKR